MIPKTIRGKIHYVSQPNDIGHRYRVGTIPIGTIVYIQDDIRPFHGPQNKICRNPWIVEAWLNREYYPCVAGRPRTTYLAGGHTAMVRSLRDGRRRIVADWLLLACVDANLLKQ